MSAMAVVTFGILLFSAAIVVSGEINLSANLLDGETLSYHKRSFLNFTEASARYGFPSEEHTVITEDGYILTIFRIRKRECKQIKGVPVILMHGLLQSSDAWIDAGPNSGLAYLLADACYDVWAGNQRGNYYSRRHVTLNPNRDPKFWQFSVDEIGLYDVSATIDYILDVTGAEKLNYVGYSQGCGVFFIMCSERPEYCDKVGIMIALAPATRHINCRSVLFRTASESIQNLEKLLYSLDIYELFPIGGVLQSTLASLCKNEESAEVICGTAIGFLDSFHPGSISAETLQTLITHFPAGTSTHNMARYGQSMQTRNFQKFDYGIIKNLELYNSAQPPSYNLAAVTAPVAIFYGSNDYIVDPLDVFWLVTRLPKVLQLHKMADPLWNHFDMTYSQHTRKMLFPKVNQSLFEFRNG